MLVKESDQVTGDEQMPVRRGVRLLHTHILVSQLTTKEGKRHPNLLGVDTVISVP
jgi:hypothetical protein